jgi:formylglycine-generating enzyme required for sulfatase activity
VNRGGSWINFARRVRVPIRLNYSPDTRFSIRGFRLARSSK